MPSYRYVGNGSRIIIRGRMLPRKDLIGALADRYGAMIEEYQARTGRVIYEPVRETMREAEPVPVEPGEGED